LAIANQRWCRADCLEALDPDMNKKLLAELQR
jgi:hypothetical protein